MSADPHKFWLAVSDPDRTQQRCSICGRRVDDSIHTLRVEPLPSPPSPSFTAEEVAFRLDGHSMSIFYIMGCGWTAIELGYHEGTGPYFSLPEALRRAEALKGESTWTPFERVLQTLRQATSEPQEKQ